MAKDFQVVDVRRPTKIGDLVGFQDPNSEEIVELSDGDYVVIRPGGHWIAIRGDNWETALCEHILQLKEASNG